MKKELRRIRRALISTFDKQNIVEFAKGLREFDVEIISTGGTAKTLQENGIQIREVSEITGFPEILDGRVKTLHPKIYAGLLAVPSKPNHLEQLTALNIEPIDMVVVNLYPFDEVVRKKNCSMDEAIENIDIGGPAMIRAAAKNWREVTVVVSPIFYKSILDEMRRNQGQVSLETRYTLASCAFSLTSRYDFAIFRFFIKKLEEVSSSSDDQSLHRASEDFFEDMKRKFAVALGDFNDEKLKCKNDSKDCNVEAYLKDRNFINANGDAGKAIGQADKVVFPDTISLSFKKIEDLRYGENPHQEAALYFAPLEFGGVARAELLQGKEMSFNNYLDADSAWRLVLEFAEPACAIIKHNNPSGVGIGENTLQAYERALSTDPVSAFGGIIAFNRGLGTATAKKIVEIFTEVVIAPSFEDEALRILRKKKNLRVLRVKPLKSNFARLDFRNISGGMLIQKADEAMVKKDDLKVVTERKPGVSELQAMLFAWKVCKHVKSNAIVIANEFRTLGIGSGQVNRLDSIKIAAMRAERFNLPLKNSVLASDAFLPFRDNVDEAAKHGISAIIQPGGSVRDNEVITAANEHGMVMIFTGMRHFRH